MNAIRLFLLLSILELYSCGNVGNNSICTANDIDDQFLEESLPLQRTPVTMDLYDPNEELFEIGEYIINGIYSGVIYPKEDYVVTTVVYDGNILWTATQGWECVYADVYSNVNTVLCMMSLKCGEELMYKALCGRVGRELHHIERVEAHRIVFRMKNRLPI
ncbi:hypothetical protein BEWA_029140 [Theileria equi strain WA]|uniref:Signal peptide-containing protein n=1 Tax=Theileria equi strain WA TaxID=1537102 RepID=L0AYU3_THEEQ|nr:hypothetical protein BEWA_029140 [Theileria equi strain WA]AFZ80064.1 hypothetical protein BEWA_029140 [Theileria equi strain WA]|eukprot:XP_004829730.1 hypothetical protein BEWA_029140 [Theileria equi strain WA]